MQVRFQEPLIVCGTGSVVVPPGVGIPDVTPALKNRKMRKFMGKQDQLAVLAADAAVQDSALDSEILRTRTGVYLCTGYIPFEREDIESIARNSEQDGEFSPQRFSTNGFEGVNPLLTFRCLPNMPIFHVSLNLEIQGRYFITYPGPGQFYMALEQASIGLLEKEIDLALVGAVADQNNFLVTHHFRRISGATLPILYDAAVFLCIRRAETASGARAEWLSYEIDYRPMQEINTEEFWNDELIAEEAPYYGAGSPAVLLHQAIRNGTRGTQRHRIRTGDGFSASSNWNL